MLYLLSLSGKVNIFILMSLFSLILSAPILPRGSIAVGCDDSTRTLANGILNNISAQYRELSLETQLLRTVDADNVNADDFNFQKSQLLFTVQKDIMTSQNNQDIMTTNSLVKQNLALVSDAQSSQLDQVQLLGNTADSSPTEDTAILGALMKSTQNIMDANMKNFQTVTFYFLLAAMTLSTNSVKLVSSCPGRNNSATTTSSTTPILSTSTAVPWNVDAILSSYRRDNLKRYSSK